MNLRPYMREMDGKNRCDLSRLLRDAAAFRGLIERLAAPFVDERITHVAGIDAIGLALAGAVAFRLDAGLVALRKGGKSAWTAHAASFTDYSGDDKCLELVSDALDAGSRVLIVDDWSETGAQLAAAARLCRDAGAVVVGGALLNVDEAVRQHPPAGIPLLHAVIRY